MGSHALFEVVKCLLRFADWPYVVGGCGRLAGYFGSWLRGRGRVVSPDVVSFVQREQVDRLRVWAKESSSSR